MLNNHAVFYRSKFSLQNSDVNLKILRKKSELPPPKKTSSVALVLFCLFLLCET